MVHSAKKQRTKIVGIIGAMSIEIDLLKKNLKPGTGSAEVQEINAGGLVFYCGQLDGIAVVLVRSGVGKVNAALCAQRLVMQFSVTHIINTGIAGAMAGGLAVLDFVVSKDAVYHDMDATGFGYKITQIPQMKRSVFVANKAMLDAAINAFSQLKESSAHKLIVGRVASGDQFINAKETKNRIKSICRPACVEMEGAAIAHAAYVNKTPFIVIRCMSDMADDNGERTYAFHEEKAAKLSAKLVRTMLPLF